MGEHVVFGSNGAFYIHSSAINMGNNIYRIILASLVFCSHKKRCELLLGVIETQTDGSLKSVNKEMSASLKLNSNPKLVRTLFTQG